MGIGEISCGSCLGWGLCCWPSSPLWDFGVNFRDPRLSCRHGKAFRVGTFVLLRVGIFSLRNSRLGWSHARENSETHVGLGVFFLGGGGGGEGGWVLFGFWGSRYFWVPWGFWGQQGKIKQVPYTLAKIRLPSLSSDDTCKVLKPCRALGGYHGQNRKVRPHSPTPFPWGNKGLYLVSRTCLKRFWGKILWLLWIGRARHPGPPDFLGICLEAFNVWGLAYSWGPGLGDQG